MNKITTRVVGRVAVATALSVGIAAGAVGVASASPVAHHGSGVMRLHDRVRGTVASYVAGTSISILLDGATSPTTFTLTSATTVRGLANGATLASPDEVVLVVSSTTPATVTSIDVRTPRADRVRGTVASYVAGTSISILLVGATSPTTFTLTSATTVRGLANGATLASPDEVVLVVSSTTPATVTSIDVRTPRVKPTEAVVSAYSAGSSITVMVNGATTPTTYTLTSATTVRGLANGATLASPDNVDLVVSSSSPTMVTAIFVEGNGENINHGNANESLSGRGDNRHAARGHGAHGHRARGVTSSKNGRDRR